MDKNKIIEIVERGLGLNINELSDIQGCQKEDLEYFKLINKINH